MAATTALLIASGLAQGYSAIKNSQAQREQAQFQADQDIFNSKIAGLQANDALSRGEQDVQNATYKATQVKGAQKAAAAGSGVDVSTGSAADLLAETDKMSNLDILTIKNNAAREAFGYQAQGLGFQSQAALTRKAGDAAANGTLLTGGAAVLNSFAGAYGSENKANSGVTNNYYYGKDKP